MANRQTKFLIKRSNVPGKVPPASGLTLGELALNTADAILYTSGSTANQILPIGWDRLSTLSGGTVSGATNFISGLTANTIYTDYIDFNLAATPIQPTLGRLSWNSTDRTLDLGNGDGDSILQIGQETVYPLVFNADSIDLIEGTLVMIDPNQIAQGNDIRVVRAITDGTYPSQYIVGILTEDILQGQLGLATWFGKVRNLNENTLEANGIKPTGETWSEGVVLYPNPLVAGGLTITQPQAPNIDGTIAVVTAVNGVNITLLVRPTLTFTLTELTNVRTTGLTDGDILVYNSGDTVWESTKTLRGDYVVDGSLSATTYYNLPYWESGSTGNYSVKIKNDSITTDATGDYSVSTGYNSVSSGDYSFSSGLDTTSQGDSSQAFGENTTAIGNLSFASGINTIASGYTSFIHSSNSTVNGDRSVVIGGQGIIGNDNDTVYVPNLNIDSTPTINNSNLDILSRNTSTGNIEIKPLSAITALDRYTTGFTYNDANQLTITDNYGGSYSTSFEIVTGLTVNGEVNTDSLQFDTTFTATTAEGKLWWSQSHETLHVGMGSGVTQEVGLDQYYHVGNPSGVTINKGYSVFASGTDAVNERINVSPMIANGTVPSKYFIGVSTSNISSGQTGFVASFGLIEDINASGSLYGESWSDGDILYVSPTISGGLTNVEPTSPNLKIETAFVLNNSATNGVIFIRPNISRNLGELNNVSADSPNNGDLLVYNSSNTLWESSKTLNGDYNITGTTSAGTFNITSTPNTNTTDDDVLVRNSITGEIENRNISSLIHTNNIITVGLTGSSGVDFYSINDAINSITGASETNTYTIDVAGGLYYTDPVTIPSWVSVKGQDSLSTIIEATDPSQTLFNMSDQCAIFDCQVQGVTGTGISAIVYSSSTTPQALACCYVENVRFGTNYTHAKVVAYGGANIIMQCSNVKYGGYPFTVGFYATNSGSGVGRMQLRNVTSTNGGIAQTTPLTFAKADASNCGFIVNGCLLTKAAGAAAGTGFYLENGGFLRLTAVNFQRWDIGIDAPNIGAGPNINAIALNFENCNTDVNIAHPNAVGKIQGTDTFLKTKINIDAPLYEVNQDPRQLTVAKKGGDFSSVKSAVDYLAASGNTSESNRFIISVGPGVFTEDEIDLTSTPYVSIVGSNIQTTQIVPSTSTQHIIKIGQNNEISFLSLSGAGTNYAAVYAYDIGDFGQLHKISIYDCDTGVWVESVTQDTNMYGEYVDMNGEFTYGTKAVGNNGYLALANMENYYLFPTSTGSTIGNYVTGSGATINVTSSTLEGFGSSGSTAFLSQDGGFFNVSSTDTTNWDYGIRLLNVGDPSQFEFNGVTFIDNTLDISVEQSSARGTFQGVSNHEKITTISENVYWSFLDATDGELDITRKASVTFTDGSHTDFTTLIFEGGTMGLIDGGTLLINTGTTIVVKSGYGYLEKSDNSGIIRRYDWPNDVLALPTDSDSYIYYNDNGILSYGGTRPDSRFNIVLGRVVTDSSNVLFIDSSPLNAEHTSNRFGSLFREALGPIYAIGSIVIEGTTPFTLDVTEGEYYFSTNEYLPMGGTGVTFTQYYRNGTGSTWVTSATTLVNNTQYDNNGTLTGLTSGYYTKHSLYVVGDGANEQYMLVLGQNEYPTLVQAEDALLPTPPSYFIDSVAQVASIYIKEGASGFTQIEDIRPRVGFRAGGVNASSVHGNLLGLTADDHPQYLLGDGARSMSGNLNLGGNDITNVNLVNGVDVSAHAARHQFGGADAVGTTTPSANAIPYADVSGTLDSWISDASSIVKGLVKLSVDPVSPTDPIAVGINDDRTTKAVTGGTFNNSTDTLTLTTVDGSLVNITGFTDYYVTGGTFNNSTDTLTLNRQDGSVTITGITDYYVTGGTYTTGTLTLDRNDGNSVVVTGFTTGIKSGSVSGTSFTGNPKKYTVTFTTAYPNTNYSITITGGANRTYTYESKSTTGFVINANANTSFTDNVDWITMSIGEF